MWFPDQRERKKRMGNRKSGERKQREKNKIEKRIRLSVNESRREEKMRLRGRKGSNENLRNEYKLFSVFLRFLSLFFHSMILRYM